MYFAFILLWMRLIIFSYVYQYLYVYYWDILHHQIEISLCIIFIQAMESLFWVMGHHE